MILVVPELSVSGDIGLWKSDSITDGSNMYLRAFHRQCTSVIETAPDGNARCNFCGLRFVRRHLPVFDLNKSTDKELIQSWAASWLEVPKENIKVEVKQ